ncbi:Metallo-dependent phosphatase-like protein [Sordaria brevicollis]|uniref:Sphingomyelin phosphodiesterase n=1 Tax=Sordaria brevicollis TaxID=83679 RepID=A0AAE0PNF4_SORBR|nr:Metallo-dependent phosphatase-like protein [Sordaria brevicollis]
MVGFFRCSMMAMAIVPAFAHPKQPPAHHEDDVSYPGSVSVFTVPGTFPASVFSSYYVKPGPTNQPQPILYDPVLNVTFPFNLTDPRNVPDSSDDPVILPQAAANLSDATGEAIVSAAVSEVLRLFESNNTGGSDTCSKCTAALAVGKMVAKLAPTHFPTGMVQLCQKLKFSTYSSCELTYGHNASGASWTQILAYADVAGLDGQYICSYLRKGTCPYPTVTSVKAKFPKPKPKKPVVPRRSGKTVKILHLSDLHLDPRYSTGSEANCTSYMCCRYSEPPANGSVPKISVSAPLFGYYKCDSPFYLAVAALQSIGPLTGTSAKNPPAFTLYTGDMIAHDDEVQASRAYIEASELAIWEMFRAYISGPIYTALGNHDTAPADYETPYAIDNNGTLGQQFSWNYEHVSGLWQHYDWISPNVAHQAATHYASYAVSPRQHKNLKVITLNSDLYYQHNPFALLNASNPDFSGMWSFLIDELQSAEDKHQRVWINAHIPTGWDGGSALPNSADYFYQIVERYSPDVIANIFFGHSHEDQFSLYYRGNGTAQTSDNALVTGWMGPSLTPLQNLNSGYRMYEVDTGTWEVMDAYTFFSDVGTYTSLPSKEGQGPVYEFEYSTRDVYGSAINWPKTAPLNATFWHEVTEAMEKNTTLVELFTKYQGKSSAKSKKCETEECRKAKICYMRSGSTALGKQCKSGYGSVQ